MPTLITLENLERFKGKLKTDIESKYGEANGIAQLDASGKLVNTQVPSDVYEVHEYNNQEAFPETGESNKIYIDKSTNNMFRWEEDEYVSISSPESIKYIQQTLSEAQKLQARQNIGAISASEIPSLDGYVRYDEAQELEGNEKVQARANIGAASSSDVSGLSETVSTLNDRLNNFGNFVREVTPSEGGINVRYDNNSTTTIGTGLDFNGGTVDDNNYLILSKNGTPLSNDIYTPIQLPAGGGGGGAVATIALSNVVRPSTVRNGKPAIFSFTATASDDTDISVTWLVNNKVVGTNSDISGSSFSRNVQDELTPSVRNTVEARITSVGGASLTRKWNIECVAFSIEWGSSIDPIMLNNSNTNIYVPINVSAEGNSTNNVTITVNETTITRQVNGSMTLTVLLNKEVFNPGVNVITASMASAEDPDDRADDIHYTLIWGTGVTSPVVAFESPSIDCNQYDLVDIYYFVFDPNNETASCTIQVGSGNPVSISARRELRRYQYSPSESGTINVVLRCGTASTTTVLNVAAVSYNLNYYSDDSLLYVLDPLGHDNSDADREEFGNLIFNNYDTAIQESDKIPFDWVNGGFKTDENGAVAFVVKKGNTVRLPRGLFEDRDTNGKTIDISFRVTNSDQYDAVAMYELNDQQSKGIILKSNNGELRLNNVVGNEFRYSEDTRIDMSVLVEVASEGTQRLATVWLDGIPSGAIKYSNNMLVQDEGQLVIGSEHCDVWVYGIRIYASALSKANMIQNYVSCGNTTLEKVDRYTKNTILDKNERITPAILHTASSGLTIIEISAPRMTLNKSDPVAADVRITDGSNVLELSGEAGTVFKVQGTSSAAYGRSSLNMDIDFKKTGKKYKISENSIPVNYLNIKVNVASSENANNINAVDWYNTYQPYITEPRTRPGVRDSVEGKPCAVFITNTSNETKWFSSLEIKPEETVLYAMGDLCNSKKNKAVFGQDGSGDHPTKACIEVSGNDTEPQRFRSTEAVFNPDADDGDGRWETSAIVDGKTVTTKHFEWRMVPASEDKDEVVASWDALVAWVVSTINDSAKFKREMHNYFAVNSMLYHFLFLEYFACYDNVSKNTFYSYDWDEDEQKYLWNIKCAYDMDTILAADNDGKPLGDYGLDFGDTVDGTPTGRQYFNAATNPIWVNIQKEFQTELSSLYVSLRSAGAWASQNIADKWNTYQDLRPHAAMIIDAYNKYIAPYKTTGVILGEDTLSYDDSYLPRLQGSKIYWRKQFLTYQTAYMDGKYGYYSKSNSTQFRTNGEASKRNYAIKVYAKTYITIVADDNRVGTKKINAGQEVVFDNVSVGNNTTMYITPDRLIQYIRPLNNTQNSTFSASGAAKLMEAILGGEEVNTAWPSGTGVTIPSTLLKDFSIRNIPNFTDALDLSPNVELETLDTRNTNTGLITLPSFSPLRSVQLNACTGLYAHNLLNVEQFTMESGNNLVSIQLENCNNTVSEAIRRYLIQAVNSDQIATRRIRAINVNWTFDNLDAIAKIATTWRGYNNLWEEQNAPVITGVINVTTLSKKKLEQVNAVWGVGSVEDNLDEQNKRWQYGDLTINYNSLIPYFEVTFLNVDGSAIKDRNGNDYIQYIDLNSQAYNPIPSDIDTPTYIDPVGQYRYTFTGWSNLGGNVTANKTVTATYSTEDLTYTVRWYDKVGGTMYDERTGVKYGEEAVYDPEGTIGLPTLTDEEVAGVFKVFKGWDKSTGFVKGDIDVYAQWEQGSISNLTANLKDMNVAQIYGITKNYRADEFFEEEDYVDIQVGKDFEFSNVESQVLLQERYFNGNEILKFDDIKLFDENSPTFTLAIDYEFCSNTSSATLISCCDSTGSAEGFRVHYYLDNNVDENESVKVLWGDKNVTVSHGLNRGMLILRHRKGSKNLLVASSNPGRYVTHSSDYGGDDLPADTYNQISRYDGYNTSIFYSEIPRAQETNTDSVLSFGAMAYGSQGQRYPAKGWIHWAKIWYEDLGSKVVRELAEWPHETWRMHYRGHDLYNKDDGTGLMDGASFIANAPLPLFYEMYPSSSGGYTTEGGWKNSLVRSFIKTRCFNALPYTWQSVIKPVSTVTKGGSDNPNNLEYTTDKLYIPSYADMMNVPSGLISSESKQVSWFTDNNSRAKFMGIITPEGAQIYTETSDPTLYTDTHTVHEGDIWAPSNRADRKYVYVSAETAARHGYYGGRYMDDSNNNVQATGSQGGMWIRSITYWTRTSYTTNNNAYSQYYVQPQGSVSYVNMQWDIAYQRKGIVLMFSL